jgi:hypothetical protein
MTELADASVDALVTDPPAYVALAEARLSQRSLFTAAE